MTTWVDEFLIVLDVRRPSTSNVEISSVPVPSYRVGGVKHPKSPRLVVPSIPDNLRSCEDMQVFIASLYYNGEPPHVQDPAASE